MEIKFQDVVREYRRQTGLPVRNFAEALKEKLVNTRLSGSRISRWETKKNIAPDLYLLLNIFTTYTDWRRDFAVDSLKAIMPHVFDSGMVTFHITAEFCKCKPTSMPYMDNHKKCSRCDLSILLPKGE